MLLVRCRTVDRTRAPSGENGRKTNLNRHSRASCACLACCWSPLACIQCVGSPRAAVIRGSYTFSKKSLENKGSAVKGYSTVYPLSHAGDFSPARPAGPGPSGGSLGRPRGRPVTISGSPGPPARAEGAPRSHFGAVLPSCESSAKARGVGGWLIPIARG